MVFYRFIQICVYVVLAIIGYGLYRLIEKPTERLGDWLHGIGFYKSWWGNVILIILVIGYIACSSLISDKIEIVYIDKRTHTIHLYENCDKIHSKNLKRTFWFVAVNDGYKVCDDCLSEKEYRLEKDLERREELRYP